jgi:hypothetical protein
MSAKTFQRERVDRWEETPTHLRKPNKVKGKTCVCCEKEFKGSGSFCSDRCRKEY